jgi:hypothetical protein
MTTEIADDLIKEEDTYQKYQEFVTKSGIDPQQDIFYVAVGLISVGMGENQQGAAVVNMRYDREKLLSLVQEESEKEFTTEDYSGFTIYSVPEEDEVFAFLDDSNVVAGSAGGVKSCIDVMQGAKDNVFQNQALADVLSRTEKDTIFWGAMLIPQDELSKATEGNPQLKPLENMKAMILNFDHRNAQLMLRIRAEGDNAESNQQISEMLTGFKAMAGMMIPEDKPELGEILQGVTVSHGPDHVKIEATVSDQLIEKLKAELPGQGKEDTQEQEEK